jgi:hypothetical protein
MKVKYPRTMHLDSSPGLQNDDRLIESLDGLIGQEVIVTEKMDGENTTLYCDHLHARSLDSKHHESRNWVKKFHGEIAHLIPEGWRICGENMYAMHSIFYDDLLSYFYGFSVWDNRNVALCIDDQNEFFNTLGIVSPSVMYRGIFDLKILHSIADNLDPVKQEGFVVRVTAEIPFDDFGVKVAKWVRKGHVQTSEHWMTKTIVPNLLRGK